jgi:hypothetical protein
VPTCVPWGIDSSCCESWEELDPALRDRSEDLAWATLRTLTGGRIGNCPTTMRPCLSPPCNLCTADWVRPMIRDGQWHNMVCGTPRCSCEPLCEIVFPGPVAAVISVDYGGTEVTPGIFRIDNGNRLVRQDGQCWPSCQDLGAPSGAPNTLTITYVPGILPTDAALWAAGTLACEFSKACTGGKCRLPAGVTAVARQGVSFAVAAGMFPEGMTGIREVDAYLTSVNPYALRSPSMVWSPDVPWARHRYGTPIAQLEP